GPFPRVEFDRVAVEPEIRIGPEEAIGEPFLALAEIGAGQARLEAGREIIEQPRLQLFEQIDLMRIEAGFLAKLAQRGFGGRLAAINPALRHLPGVTHVVPAQAGAAADPDMTTAREHREADIGTIER